MKKIRFIFLAMLLLCSAEISYAVKLDVITSIYPLKDIIKHVGGEMVNVDFIVPPGASPHTFEPTPLDMKRLNSAKLFIIIGSGFEFWAERAVKAGGGKELKVVALSKGLTLIHTPHSHGEHGGHDDRDIADPHIWLDPVLAEEMAVRIATALIELDTPHKSYYEQRTDAFRKELQALHAKITKSVKNFRIKDYVTFHPAWSYFSRRYGLRVIGVIEEAPGKEATPKHISEIIRHIKQTGARVVFAEPQFNPKIAEVIAKEAGARVLFLDPIGGPDMKGKDTYIDLMNYNLSILEQALK